MSDKLTSKDLRTGGSNSPQFTSIIDLRSSGVPINKIPDGAGVSNTFLERTPFEFIPSPGAKELASYQGASIVLGQSPPTGDFGGYGAKGFPADSIDLVVGRQAASYGGKGPSENSVVETNFQTDAARIYISRLCDIDQAFGLESNPGINEGRGMIARSGIGIKADGIRIIGREGVKITTGAMIDKKETNSLGGKPAANPRIELIAGNVYDDKVEGVAKGNTTSMCLSELAETMGEMWSSIYRIGRAQARLNRQLGIGLSPRKAAAAARTNAEIRVELGSLSATRANLAFWRMRYLMPQSPRRLESRNVKAN